ncbi:MAG: hypothetical protein J0I09_13770 [Sphingobacteriia bacterium]|nr:hypothetical protein [Sphingobacteriia bacterium]
MGDTSTEFEVIIKRNIPFLSKSIYWTWAAILVILFLLSMVFLPSTHQSSEMKTVYFLLAVPKTIQYIISYLSIGFIIFYILMLITKRYDKAILTFQPDKIQICGKNIDRVIEISNIEKVYCMDAQKLNGDSKEKLTIYIEDKNEIETAIRLKYYLQTDDFMSNLINYENLKLDFFNFDIAPNAERED